MKDDLKPSDEIIAFVDKAIEKSLSLEALCSNLVKKYSMSEAQAWQLVKERLLNHDKIITKYKSKSLYDEYYDMSESLKTLAIKMESMGDLSGANKAITDRSKLLAELKALEEPGTSTSNKLNDTIKKAILESLANGNTHTAAAKAAGVSRVTVWQWRKEDPEFAEACEHALASRVLVAEDALFENTKRGKEGSIIFTLCNLRPEKWRNVSQIEHSGPNGGAIETKHELNDASTASAVLKILVESGVNLINANAGGNGNGHKPKRLEP